MNTDKLIFSLRNISIEPDKYGNTIVIKQVGIYDDNDKFVRNAKITEELVKIIRERLLDIKI